MTGECLAGAGEPRKRPGESLAADRGGEKSLASHEKSAADHEKSLAGHSPTPGAHKKSLANHSPALSSQEKCPANHEPCIFCFSPATPTGTQSLPQPGTNFGGEVPAIKAFAGLGRKVLELRGDSI